MRLLHLYLLPPILIHSIKLKNVNIKTTVPSSGELKKITPRGISKDFRQPLIAKFRRNKILNRKYPEDKPEDIDLKVLTDKEWRRAIMNTNLITLITLNKH